MNKIILGDNEKGWNISSKINSVPNLKIIEKLILSQIEVYEKTPIGCVLTNQQFAYKFGKNKNYIILLWKK